MTLVWTKYDRKQVTIEGDQKLFLIFEVFPFSLGIINIIVKKTCFFYVCFWNIYYVRNYYILSGEWHNLFHLIKDTKNIREHFLIFLGTLMQIWKSANIP